MTSDLASLSLHFDYLGYSDIMIGNGTGLPIVENPGSLCSLS